jgi:hypothetical protein
MSIDQHQIDHWIIELKKKPDLRTMVDQVIADPSILAILFQIIRGDKSSLKFFCDKIIRSVSEQQPRLVYPYFKIVAGLIDSPNNFIKWGAILTLANLLTVDDEHQFDAVYEHLLALIDSDSMITAANAASCAEKIILKYPEREPDVTRRLLKVSGNTYLYKGELSPECKNIMIGHVLDCFDSYFASSALQDKMLEFAASQCDNTRKKVARNAEAFLTKHGRAETLP